MVTFGGDYAYGYPQIIAAQRPTLLPTCSIAEAHLISYERCWVNDIVVGHEKVRRNRSSQHAKLKSSKPRHILVSRGLSPHGHGVVEINVLGSALLVLAIVREEKTSALTGCYSHHSAERKKVHR